jgi:hypothetical protein
VLDIFKDLPNKTWSCDVWSDWDSFIFWKPYNWRDFTVINISGEIGVYTSELHLAILGFHLFILKFEN